MMGYVNLLLRSSGLWYLARLVGFNCVLRRFEEGDKIRMLR